MAASNFCDDWQSALKSREKNQPLIAVSGNINHRVPMFRDSPVEFLRMADCFPAAYGQCQHVDCGVGKNVWREKARINWKRDLDMHQGPLSYKKKTLTPTTAVQVLNHEKCWLVIAKDINIPVNRVDQSRSPTN